MIKKILITLAVVLLSILLCACLLFTFWLVLISPRTEIIGSSKQESEVRDVKNFKNIVLDASFNLTLEESTKEEIEISAEDNILSKITTDVRGDTLYISTERKFPYLFGQVLKNNLPIQVNVKYKNLNSLEINSSGKAEAKSKIRTDNLTLKVNGSGEIKLSIFSQSLNAEVNGSGNIILDGSATKQNIKVNGSGKFIAENLEAKESEVSVTGSGECRLRSDESLKVDVNGSGNIYYSGNPKKFSQNITGSGTVTKL